MKRLVICVLTAAIVAHIWGMVSWMFLGWHMWDFRQFEDGRKVAEVIRSEAKETGLYTLPNMDESLHEDPAKMEEWNKQASEGPFAFISIRAKGINPGMGPSMAIGFLINLFTAAVLFWLLAQTNLRSPMDRVFFVALAGSIGALYPHLSNWNWWHFPLSYCVVGVVDLFVTWGLAGFAMVKLGDKLAR